MSPETIVNAVGTAAGLFSMASFVPQVVKIVREKRAEGVALHTYVLTVSNAVNLVLSAAILALRWHYGDGDALKQRSDSATKTP
jgi:MtN3 and saliva related transmembrane protein